MRGCFIAAFPFAAVLLLGGLNVGRAAETAQLSDSAAEQETAPASEPLPKNCHVISENGFCGVKFGMTTKEAMDAFPGGLHGLDLVDLNDPDEASCFYLGIAENDYDVAFMFSAGVLERIDISTSEVATPQGAKVGMRLEDVQALFPKSSREPNFYTAPNENLIVPLSKEIFALFEEDSKGAVNSYRVGREAAVRLVEGCA